METYQYSSEFKAAQQKTCDLGYQLDNLKKYTISTGFQELLDEETSIIVNTLYRTFDKYKELGFSPVNKFRTDCFGIHMLIYEYLQTEHINSTITLGSIEYDGKSYFEAPLLNYIQGTTQIPMDEKVNMPVISAHAWITIEDRIIIDATIGSYLINPQNDNQCLGKLIYGDIGKLYTREIQSKYEYCNENKEIDLLLLTYHPVVTGINVFKYLFSID
ncbi:hypothetical protein [Acidithiobacillus sp. HP-11]|uniref:hypothetical protein n=1 Tax=Acidithiobacillus sp. HP-11 TaxID=2697656 RepID=UPI001879919A|nr:hypothetical protein [Acidithiobacillus sp. HP-11]MBE7566842.1 hypothetical protein [Acidithiobacillus sp. HP-11]